MDAWKAVVSDGGCQHLAAMRIFSVKTRYSQELSFSWVSAGMLVIALQDSVIGKDFKPFWGCLLQSGRLLCWKQTRAKPRASPAGMWQTRLCPLDITEMWSQPKYQISWWKKPLFCLFWAALLLPEEAMPWAGGGEKLGGQYKGQEGFICACSVPVLFPGHLLWPVPGDRHDPVSPFLDLLSCGFTYFTAAIMKTEAFRQFLFQSSIFVTLPYVVGYVLENLQKVQIHHLFLWRFVVLVNNPGWIFTLVLC